MIQSIVFDAPFRHATEGMLITDHTGVILEINPAAEKIFGYLSGELTGEKIEVLMPADKRHKHATYRDKFNTNPRTRGMAENMDIHGLKKNGELLPVEIGFSPFSVNSNNYILVIITDIALRRDEESRIKRYYTSLETEVEKRTLALKETIAELETTKLELSTALTEEKKLNDLKSRFVSMVSHEFRTPLAAMLSSLGLIEIHIGNNDKEKLKKHVARIRESLKGLNTIIGDVLSVGQIEAGSINVVLESFNFKTYLENVLEDMQLLAKPNQEIIIQSINKNEMVISDKNILRQILFNLISNALKFSPDGSSVIVSIDITDTELSFSVKDFGFGISQEEQKNVFTRFFRASNVTNIQGTGLGLSIVAKLVELLNGKIGFESKLDIGSQFHVTLPMERR